MPAKAALASTPFKGETFPQYVLYRSTRGGSTRQCITIDIDTQVPTTKLLQSPATFLAAASAPKQELPLTRRGRIASTAFRRPLPSPSLRPSLSEQLKTISNGAQAITAQLTTTYNLTGHANVPALTALSSSDRTDHLAIDSKAFQATTIGLNVGKLECRFPCPVTFSLDRCTYLFQHPFEATEVLMIMYYRDMLYASVNMTDYSFRFRLSRVLEQFGDDYNPANAQHWIRIVLATSSEAHKVKLFLAGRGVTDKKRALLL